MVLDSLFADRMWFHPHLIDFTQEFGVVHAHFIFCAMAIVVSVISIIFSIRRVKRSVGMGPSRITHGASGNQKYAHSSGSSVTVKTKNTSRESHKTIKSVQRRIMA
jgi:hypothetical protein